ncbi:NAD(P)H-dependent oxidoreductase [Photobacterium sp. 2_MG-2023]|uniref:NAD(P)H-dependent oxidoreductase n=1 Tax=Photobacterium sp. 2_MG-2023 TaxID=3062663 RepID=UPI0026E263CA|nr:NAD(P)H-dependent oxidoreductase [Photobacterium sp. 2_MG-2023]MDO6580235.1 NAD(P)H-dependent oxidoreductase [Photobacterium sp. 2_MG-2023]
MNILIVHCHPEPMSFNASLKNTAVAYFESSGHQVEVSDLYLENFDPVEKAEHYLNRVETDRFDILSEQRNAYKTKTLPSDVQREIQRLENCDLVIFQFPLWWHQQPAMLKGWFDRVFVGGGLYTSKMRYDKGYFKGKRAICSVTSGAPLSTFTENGRGGGDIQMLLHSLSYSLHYMGFTVLPPYLSTEIQNKGFTYKSPSQFNQDLQDNLADWENQLSRLDDRVPMSFPGWDDWDELGNEKDKNS